MKNKGFTLVEMIIVMAIVAIIGASLNSVIGSTVRIKKSVEKSSDMNQTMRNIETRVRSDARSSNSLIIPQIVSGSMKFTDLSMTEVNKYISDNHLTPCLYLVKPDGTEFFYAIDNSNNVHRIQKKITINNKKLYYPKKTSDYSWDNYDYTDDNYNNEWSYLNKLSAEAYKDNKKALDYDGTNVVLKTDTDSLKISTDYYYNYTSDHKVDDSAMFGYRYEYNSEQFTILSAFTDDTGSYIVLKCVNTRKSIDQFIKIASETKIKPMPTVSFDDKVISNSISSLTISPTSNPILFDVNILYKNNSRQLTTRVSLIDYNSQFGN